MVPAVRDVDHSGVLVLLSTCADVPDVSTQALIQRVTEEVEAESGVELDQLINPAKVSDLQYFT